jgi:hypothetical protein
MIEHLMGLLNDFIDALLDITLAVLPTSPFSAHISALAGLPYLGILNWFVPIGAMVAVGAAWLAAVAVYYIIMIILRWLKAIE